MSRSPHWQEDLSQGDQGDTRQSTGQSMLQEDDDHDDGGGDGDGDGGDGSYDEDDNEEDKNEEDTCKRLQSPRVGQDEHTENQRLGGRLQNNVINGDSPSPSSISSSSATLQHQHYHHFQ